MAPIIASKKRKVSHKSPVPEKRARQDPEDEPKPDSDSESGSDAESDAGSDAGSAASDATPEDDEPAAEKEVEAPKTFKELVSHTTLLTSTLPSPPTN